MKLVKIKTWHSNDYTRSAVGFVAMNANNGATADKAVRQALMYATDRQGFCDSYFGWDKKQVTKLKKLKVDMYQLHTGIQHQ